MSRFAIVQGSRNRKATFRLKDGTTVEGTITGVPKEGSNVVELLLQDGLLWLDLEQVVFVFLTHGELEKV
ncbi:hypothetical protein EXE59_16625 [Nocardioides eburneiflavus]|uniref:KOW domain-containing protein n=1 Tax=Nocardioides eburneiflavus TaxID=2518372 RepID=A0A4Z1CH70_9ACTN|nr:hypothetical protein [Nocardioides eburneiflavus]TGN65398.1 hypothetical protein EXE59_16625 [Nocardioides eburneiflavus]